ncbi:MAG: DUF4012 domain-containing protein [Actinomycetota bacterium]
MLLRSLLTRIAAALLLAWTLACALTALSIISNSRDGRDALRSARRGVGLTELLDGTLVDKVEGAADAFDTAHDRASSALWLPVRRAPVIGRQLSSTRALTGVVRQLAEEIAEAGKRAQALIDDAPSGPEGRLAAVEGLVTIVEGVESQIAAADLGPDDALVSPLADARDELAAELDELGRDARHASAALSALARLLDGPSSTLVFAANNAEMRAGSGMLLAGGILESEGGRGDVSDFESVEDVVAPAGSVALPEELESLWGWAEPDLEIRNLLLSPRFPVAAAVAADIWQKSGRPPVEGVIAIDPVALGAIVRVTGPVTVGSETFDADTLVDELLHEQYVRFARSDRPERQERSADIAAAVLRAAVDGDWDLVDMAEALRKAVAGRHLFMWSNDPDAQAGWEGVGVAGDLEPDSILLALNNRGAGKTDQFIRVDAALESERTEAGVDVRITVCVENRTPEDEPPTVTNDRPDIGLTAGQYRGILVASVPGAARSVRVAGSPPLHVAGTDGPSRVIGLQLELARGASREVVVELTLPGSWASVLVEPSARVPAIRWSDASGTWRDRSDDRRPLTDGEVDVHACGG